MFPNERDGDQQYNPESTFYIIGKWPEEALEIAEGYLTLEEATAEAEHLANKEIGFQYVVWECRPVRAVTTDSIWREIQN